MLLLLMLHEALEFRQLVLLVIVIKIKANAAAAAIVIMEWIVMEIAHVDGESMSSYLSSDGSCCLIFAFLSR